MEAQGPPSHGRRSVTAFASGHGPGAALFRNALILGSAAGSAQALVVLASPVLTRLYRPEDFGIYGAAISVISIAASVGALRYEQALLLPRTASATAAVLAAILGATAVTLIGTLTSIFLLHALVGGIEGVPSEGIWAWLIAAGVIGAVALIVVSALAVRERAYKQLAISKGVQGIAVVATQILAGLVGAAGVGLLIGDILARAIATVKLVTSLSLVRKLRVRAVSRRRVRWAIVRYRRFPLLSGPSAFFNALGLQGPTILLLALYGAEVSGWYLLVQRIGAVPVGLVGSAISSAFLGEAANLRRTNPAALETLFRHTWVRLAAVTVPGLIVVIPSAPLVVPFVFGAPWTEAGLFLAILAPMFAVQFVAMPLGGTLDVLERQDLHLLREAVRVLLVAGAFAYAWITEAPPTHTVIALSVAGTASYAFYFWTSRRAVIKSLSGPRRRAGATVAGPDS